jgi:hypothetical protein
VTVEEIKIGADFNISDWRSVKKQVKCTIPAYIQELPSCISTI